MKEKILINIKQILHLISPDTSQVHIFEKYLDEYRLETLKEVMFMIDKKIDIVFSDPERTDAHVTFAQAYEFVRREVVFKIEKTEEKLGVCQRCKN